MASIKNMIIRLGMHTDVDQPVNRTTRALERVARQADDTERSMKVLGMRFDSIGSAASAVTSRVASFTGSLLSAGVQLITAAATMAALASALALATSTSASLVAALAPLGGLLAALPGLVLSAAAAFAVWKLATAGLGEAMGAVLSGNAKALESALEKLGVSGRAFVIEFEKVVPQLKNFQEAAQSAFLEQITGRLDGWAQALRGLTPSVSALAGEFGRMVRTVLDFATSGHAIGQFSVILGATRDLVAAVRQSLEPLLKGFVDLAAVGSRWLAGFAPGLRDVLTTFGQWMTRVAESGQAWQWLDNALLVLKAFGGVAKDVGGILSGVFSAAQSAGTGALGVIGQLVEKLNAWVNSAQGQDTLVTVFKALDQVGRALVPVLAALGGAIAAIAPEAAKIATALGPVLAEAVTVLGKGIAAMGPGLVQMVEGFGRMVTAIGPLEPLGAAIGDIFAALGGALALVVPEVAKIALALAPALTAALQALGPALAALGPGLIAVAGNLAKAFASEEMQHGLLALGNGLSDVLVAIAPLLPFVGQLAGILGQVLGGALTNLGVALGPIIAALATALEPALGAISRALDLLIPLMEPIYKAFGDIGAALITELLPPILDLIPAMIDSLIPAFIQFAKEIQPLIPLLADFAIMFVKDILPAILPMMPQLTQMSLEFARLGIILGQLVADVAPFIERIIAVFQHLYDTLVGHSIIPDLIQGIRDWFQKGVDWVKGIVAWFGELPGMIGAWLGMVVTWVQAKWNLIKNYIADKIDEVKQKISDVLNAISDRWNDAWGKLKGFVAEKFDQIKTAISDKIDQVLQFFRDLPGRIAGALGSLGGTLYNAGRDLLVGLWNGLVSMWQWLKDSIYSFFSSIMPQWVKDALGIASPSKVFAEIGRMVPAGMALGIERAAGLVQGAVAGLATTATVAMGGMAVAPAYAGGAPVGGGGAGAVYQITVNVPVSASPASVGEEIVKAIGEHERRAGAGWRS